MKAIMISDKPKWCALMMNGIKKIEVRKGTALYKATKKLIDEYGWVEFYVYCSKNGGNLVYGTEYRGGSFVDEYGITRGYSKQKANEIFGLLNGKVVFKFRCYKVEKITPQIWSPIKEKEVLNGACLNEYALFDYICSHDGTEDKPFYAIHISDLEIFDEPKDLSEFYSIVKEKVKTDCPLNCKRLCVINYNCKYYVEDDYWGGQLACSCPIKKVNVKKLLTKAPQNFCYVEVEE